MPRLVQRPRVWNKRDSNCPTSAVYVGRPSKWGNPYKIGVHGTREEVIALYRYYVTVLHPEFAEGARIELRKRHLVCWCAPLPCHADVLFEIANAPHAD